MGVLGASLVLALGLARSAPAAAQAHGVRSGRLIAENEFASVRDMAWSAGEVRPHAGAYDMTLVYLEGRPAGQVEFERRGAARGAAAEPIAGRAIVIDLHDRAMAAYPNRTGYPPAFPRPGAKQLLENDRVVVWDYTFTPDVPSPVHFHERDVVVVFLGDGTLASNPLTGPTTTRDHTNGMAMFNPGNRAHTETLIRGTARVIVVELR